MFIVRLIDGKNGSFHEAYKVELGRDLNGDITSIIINGKVHEPINNIHSIVDVHDKEWIEIEELKKLEENGKSN